MTKVTISLVSHGCGKSLLHHGSELHKQCYKDFPEYQGKSRPSGYVARCWQRELIN